MGKINKKTTKHIPLTKPFSYYLSEHKEQYLFEQAISGASYSKKKKNFHPTY